MRIGSLFSGVGGLELGLEAAGVGHTVWQVEIDPLSTRVLARHWPKVERFDDVRTFDRTTPKSLADVICGGFPCQDVSTAGKRTGLSGARSGLWSEFRRIVSEFRPRFVVVENVHDGRHLWLPTVRRDLHLLGYDSTAYTLSAAEVGAPHERGRIFVVCYTDRPLEPMGAFDAQVAPVRRPAIRLPTWTERGGRRVADGVPDRVDLTERTRMMGNAVVPQCAEVIGRILVDLQNVLRPAPSTIASNPAHAG